MQRLTHWFFALALAFMLGACGGGGGGSDLPAGNTGEGEGAGGIDANKGDEESQTPAPITEFPFRAAVEKLATAPQVHSLNGTGSDGQPYALSFSSAPGPDKVFPDATFKTFTLNEVITTPGGGTLISVTEILYWNPFVVALIVHNGNWVTGSPTFEAPLTATVGTSSYLFENGTVYDRDFLLNPPLGTAALNWRFTRHSPTSAWMCLELARTEMGNAAATEYCFAIDENGDASALRVSVSSDAPGGLSVEFQ